jgi:hypothetical protein
MNNQLESRFALKRGTDFIENFSISAGGEIILGLETKLRRKKKFIKNYWERVI